MKLILLYSMAILFGLNPTAPPAATGNPLSLATELYNALDEEQKQTYFRSFDDSRRKTWERLPKEREGLKLAGLSDAQKALFHQFLRASLSSEGYLMVTAIMFNEDIQQRFEPYLGRNEYYIELFGMPQENAYWGWQLEGHHLSVNLTFKGNSLIAHTPMLLASNPQVVNSDRDRMGLALLYLEEQLAGELGRSLEGQNKSRGYSPAPPPKQVYGELDKTRLNAPDEGVSLKSLNQTQKGLAGRLTGAYLRYFNFSDAQRKDLLDEMTGGDTQFYFMHDFGYDQEHYFRLKNKETLIECENYGNHSHHFWRSANDFGEKVIKS